MPRPSARPTTTLGVAMQARRAGRSQRAVAEETGISDSTLSNIERGSHAPSLSTALALARWLGWTVEAVSEAARTAVP